MEDAYHLDMDFAHRGWVYGGVYDGHGGDGAARYAAVVLHGTFLGAYLSGLAPADAFASAYEQVDRELAHQDSGTTATDFFIRESDLFVANAGDSRAVIVGKRGITQLTTDHRLSDDNERKRVLQTGGGIRLPYVTRGAQGIMTTRSLGDPYFRPAGVIAAPFTAHHALSSQDMFLISASDGLWDVITSEQIFAVASKSTDPAELLSALKNEVLNKRQGTDNLTVIAISLR